MSESLDSQLKAIVRKSVEAIVPCGTIVSEPKLKSVDVKVVKVVKVSDE